MTRPTAQGTKRLSKASPFPPYAYIRKSDDMRDLVDVLVAHGRNRRVAEQTVVIAYTLRGYRPPGRNQVPELNELAMRLKGKP